MRKGFEIMAYLLTTVPFFLIVVTQSRPVFFTCLIVLMVRFVWQLVAEFNIIEKAKAEQPGDEISQFGHRSRGHLLLIALGNYAIPSIGIFCVTYLFFHRAEMWG